MKFARSMFILAILAFSVFGFAQPTPASAQTAIAGVTSIGGECVVVDAYASTVHCLQVSEQRELELAGAGSVAMDAPERIVCLSCAYQEMGLPSAENILIHLQAGRKSVVQHE